MISDSGKYSGFGYPDIRIPVEITNLIPFYYKEIYIYIFVNLIFGWAGRPGVSAVSVSSRGATKHSTLGERAKFYEKSILILRVDSSHVKKVPSNWLHFPIVKY